MLHSYNDSPCLFRLAVYCSEALAYPCLPIVAGDSLPMHTVLWQCDQHDQEARVCVMLQASGLLHQGASGLPAWLHQ